MQNGADPKDKEIIDACWNRHGVWADPANRCPELGKVIHCRNCPTYANAGRRLLDRPPPPEYQQEWTMLLTREKPSLDVNTKTAFVFRAGGEWLALPASLIREVVEMATIHSLPHRSSKILRGVVNIRGKLEICVSIGGILGIEREEKEEQQNLTFVTPERLVVAARSGKNLVFPVSEVRGHVRYRPDMLRDLPVTVSGSKAVYTKGILNLGDMDVGILVDELLFSALTRSLA